MSFKTRASDWVNIKEAELKKLFPKGNRVKLLQVKPGVDFDKLKSGLQKENDFMFYFGLDTSAATPTFAPFLQLGNSYSPQDNEGIELDIVTPPIPTDGVNPLDDQETAQIIANEAFLKVEKGFSPGLIDATQKYDFGELSGKDASAAVDPLRMLYTVARWDPYEFGSSFDDYGPIMQLRDKWELEPDASIYSKFMHVQGILKAKGFDTYKNLRKIGAGHVTHVLNNMTQVFFSLGINPLMKDDLPKVSTAMLMIYKNPDGESTLYSEQLASPCPPTCS